MFFQWPQIWRMIRVIHHIFRLYVDTCSTTNSMRITATGRIESHMQHVVCCIITVCDFTPYVVYRGFTIIIFFVECRILSHSIKVYYWENQNSFVKYDIFLEFPRELMGSFFSLWHLFTKRGIKIYTHTQKFVTSIKRYPIIYIKVLGGGGQ